MHVIAEGDTDDPMGASDTLIQQVADDYDISNAEVRAAIAYYARNRTYIDAWLTINFDTGEDTYGPCSPATSTSTLRSDSPRRSEDSALTRPRPTVSTEKC